MNIFSAFDGKSCGQIALTNLGIPITNYYASEIDKSAIQVTQNNYPNTVQVGDITKLNILELLKIDLLIGGSPCVSFSIAGKKEGFDGKSKLFWDYHRLYKELQPKYFLLENVVMKKEWEDIISNAMSVSPIRINSNTQTAQNRNRLYWTNIPQDEMLIKDMNLEDILEDDIDGTDIKHIYDKEVGLYSLGKAPNGKEIFVDTSIQPPYTFYETRTEEGKRNRRETRQLTGLDTTPRNANSKMYLNVKHKKANCLLATENFLNTVVDNQYKLRKLTTTERCRLQGVPDQYFIKSNTSTNQANKMLGNGWTVPVIEHLLKNIKN